MYCCIFSCSGHRNIHAWKECSVKALVFVLQKGDFNFFFYSLTCSSDGIVKFIMNVDIFPASSIFANKHFITQLSTEYIVKRWFYMIRGSSFMLETKQADDGKVQVYCFEVIPYLSQCTLTAIWLRGPPTQNCSDKIVGRFLLFWARTSPHDMGMSASEMSAHTHCLHYLIHATCLGFQNLFFSFTDGNNVDDPRGSILWTSFQLLLVVFYVFKTAAYAMSVVRLRGHVPVCPLAILKSYMSTFHRAQHLVE